MVKIKVTQGHEITYVKVRVIGASPIRYIYQIFYKHVIKCILISVLKKVL